MESKLAQINELKQNLRSILIISPMKITIEQLQEDYFNFEGHPIPYRQFGFNSVTELLQNFNDTFAIPTIPNKHSIVTLIHETKSEHLKQLIANQKKPVKHNYSRTLENVRDSNNSRKSAVRRKILPKNSKSNGHANGNDSNQNGNYNPHSCSQNIGTNKDSFLSNHSSDVPNKPLMLPDINNSKQFENGDHIIDKICTSVLKKSDAETTNLTNGYTIKEDVLSNNCKIKQNIHGLSTLCQSEIIESANSTLEKNHCDNIDCSVQSNKTNTQLEQIPNEILIKLSMVFRAYNNIMSLVLFEFIYIKAFHSLLEPEYFGCNSILEFFKKFDQIFEIRNNLLYKKIQFKSMKKFYDIEKLNYSKRFLMPQIDIKRDVFENFGLLISLNIVRSDIPIHSIKSFVCIISEAYNPSCFFVQNIHTRDKLKDLMKQMQRFYNKENTKYCVAPNHVLAGSNYCTFYSECRQKWRRVKILREVNSTLVQVIQVDFGIVDYILKENLRFLKREFCDFPSQAIQCCLTDFNMFGTISRNATDEFFYIIKNNEIFTVDINTNLVLNRRNQILHVTLFDNSLRNINLELIKFHS